MHQTSGTVHQASSTNGSNDISGGECGTSMELLFLLMTLLDSPLLSLYHHTNYRKSYINSCWPDEMTDLLIEYRLNSGVTNKELETLFADAWPETGKGRDYAPVLSRSLGYVCAYLQDVLVGFANVAWDGGDHAFLLDPVVRTDVQRQGIGSELVRLAKDLARSEGVEWLHVDYEPHLEEFYRKCGFTRTNAGLINLRR
jgi:GNAT superfamily N-acetyltransferase